MAQAKTTALDTDVLPKAGHQDSFRSDDEKSSLKDKEAGVTKIVPSSDEDLARYGDVYEGASVVPVQMQDLYKLTCYRCAPDRFR